MKTNSLRRFLSLLLLITPLLLVSNASAETLFTLDEIITLSEDISSGDGELTVSPKKNCSCERPSLSPGETFENWVPYTNNNCGRQCKKEDSCKGMLTYKVTVVVNGEEQEQEKKREETTDCYEVEGTSLNINGVSY